MNRKVMFSHDDKSRSPMRNAKIREGKEVYRHPEGRFIVLEFQGIGGKFREAFHPIEIIGWPDEKSGFMPKRRNYENQY